MFPFRARPLIRDPGVAIIGAGLAGCEAAWQAAQSGVRVTLYEMRPQQMTPAHVTDQMAELVCSNSLGSNLPDRPLGILKNELRRLNSLNIRCADDNALPAGDALAVGRDAFSRGVTQAISQHPNITVVRGEVSDLQSLLGGWPAPAALVIATGPLTSPTLSAAIQELAGQNSLYFFDAMAPIVAYDSIDLGIAFRANRWEWQTPPPGQGPEGDAPAGRPLNQGSGSSAESGSVENHPLTRLPVAPLAEPAGDYINCPLDREQYYAFVEAINASEKLTLRGFEQDDEARRYFEGCLPIEVLAARDADALAYGPMRPVGLRNPHTGRRPWAVVQLRQDNVAGTLYNIVGFQTNIKWGDQERVLRMIPGLAEAEFVRFGQMHRNTFINSPQLLQPTLQWRDRPNLFFAGQITGTEGYVGSTAGGWLAGTNAARVVLGQAALTLPPTTMMGALFHYITHAAPADFQPMKANLGLFPPLENAPRGKRERAAAYAVRALADLEFFLLQ